MTLCTDQFDISSLRRDASCCSRSGIVVATATAATHFLQGFKVLRYFRKHLSCGTLSSLSVLPGVSDIRYLQEIKQGTNFSRCRSTESAAVQFANTCVPPLPLRTEKALR
mmetsp:Transcript_20326/g.32790  ORF Transcript_20326/g.32790 Transcript_20326/m.32790 type:complete len:110 (+) Transcript_20326:461-790(+)